MQMENATISEKITWERFSLNVPYTTCQNYFQNNCSAETYLLAPGQCCFLQTSKDQTFFRRDKNIAPRGKRGKGRIGTATMFRKMLTKCAILSRVLSKIVDSILAQKDVSESARMNTAAKLMFSQKPLDNAT